MSETTGFLWTILVIYVRGVILVKKPVKADTDSVAVKIRDLPLVKADLTYFKTVTTFIFSNKTSIKISCNYRVTTIFTEAVCSRPEKSIERAYHIQRSSDFDSHSHML